MPETAVVFIYIADRGLRLDRLRKLITCTNLPARPNSQNQQEKRICATGFRLCLCDSNAVGDGCSSNEGLYVCMYVCMNT